MSSVGTEHRRRIRSGLLAHAHDMSAITNQWVNPYKRLVPGYEAPVYGDRRRTGKYLGRGLVADEHEPDVEPSCRGNSHEQHLLRALEWGRRDPDCYAHPKPNPDPTCHSIASGDGRGEFDHPSRAATPYKADRVT